MLQKFIEGFDAEKWAKKRAYTLGYSGRTVEDLKKVYRDNPGVPSTVLALEFFRGARQSRIDSALVRWSAS